MFSKTASNLRGEQNALYALRDRLKEEGRAIRELISGNINEQGFLFPQETLEELLVRASRDCRVYRPDPLGRREARDAVADYYRSRGIAIDAGNVLITPGTSISYWYCFKILADEGDEILCPCPSYPLFDYIALLSGIRLVHYPMDEKRQWAIDMDHLETCVSTKTRAIVLISPHNPTGHVASQGEIDALAEVARRHDLAIISDEVFSEFLIGRDTLPRPAAADAPLVFTLNGFSKMFALPGLKFGWMAVSGERDRVRRAMEALEMASDTFLPVNETVQAAAPGIFSHGREVSAGFARRIQDCWRIVEGILAKGRNISYHRPSGGFYVTLRLDGLDEEQTALAILEGDNLLVHPGYFYDMDPHHIVFSFVQAREVIHDAVAAMVRTISLRNGTPRGPQSAMKDGNSAGHPRAEREK